MEWHKIEYLIISAMGMRKRHLFCASSHHNVTYEKQEEFNKGYEPQGILLPPCLSVSIGIWTLAHKSDPRTEISVEIFRYDGLAPGPEVLLSWCFVLRMRRFPLALVLIIVVGMKWIA